MKKAFLQLHIAVLLAGFTAVFGKLIGLNEGMLVWYRILLTVVILGCIMLFRKQLIKISWRDTLRIAGVGGIIAFHWVAFYGSIKYANMSVGLVCLSMSGFFTALFEPVILKRKIIVPELLLGILAIVGIYIIFDFHPQYKMGIIFGVFSAMGAALFPILNKRLVVRFAPRVVTLYELSGGLIILSLLLPIYLSQFTVDRYLPTHTEWFWLLVLAALCTVVCFDLQLNALKKISAFTANLTYNLEPVYGIILAFAFYGESKLLHTQFYIGFCLIMLAVIIQMLRIYGQAKRPKNEYIEPVIHA